MRQRDAARVAHQQLHAQPLFQCIDAPADHRRRHTLGVGRRGQTALGRHRGERLDLHQPIHGPDISHLDVIDQLRFPRDWRRCCCNAKPCRWPMGRAMRKFKPTKSSIPRPRRSESRPRQRIECVPMVTAAHLLPTPRAVLFDVYGTLFDVYSVGVRAESLFAGAGARLALLWRDKQIEYTRLVTLSRRYRPFSDLTQRALQFACARLQLELTPAARDALTGEYQRLQPFAENEAVLRALQARGVRAGVLSNGDPPMLDAVIAHAGFTPLLDPV